MNRSGRTAKSWYEVSGSGPDIVFVHGNGSTHKTWRGTIENLTNDFRCISYDLRGHGASNAHYDAFTLDMLVDDLEELRVHLALDQLYLVGHSLGALIAAEYAYRYPQRVERLCMIAAPAGRSRQDKAAAEALLEQLRTRGVQETMSNLVKLWYTEAFVAANPGSLAARLDQVLSIDERVFIDAYDLYVATEIAPRLERLAMPTLVMTGEHASGCSSRVAQYTADAIPASELVVLREMKNGVLTEVPHRVARAISDFLLERVSRAEMR